MEYINEWEQSYRNKQNFIFQPKEEVVKFINRFIRKQAGFNEFKDIILAEGSLKALDFGCGIGRQAILFKQFNIESWGVDISSVAIEKAKILAQSFGFDMHDRFLVVDKTVLPFTDNFFNFTISDSVLDSMPFETAKEYIKELDRTVTNFLYISLISGSNKEVEVMTEHEKGTIQSYFTEDKINQLIQGTSWKIKQLNEISETNILTKEKKGRYHIVLDKQ